MCYCGCPHESYPEGPNEECRCNRGKQRCPAENMSVDYQSATDKDDYEPEPESEWERSEREDN